MDICALTHLEKIDKTKSKRKKTITYDELQEERIAASFVNDDSLPEPDKYLAQKRIKGIYKKYMKLSKHQRKNIKWVDYPNIWC